MKKILALLILISFLCVSAFAQQIKDKPDQTKEWVRVQSDNGEFSFEMPSDFVYFYDKDGLFLSPRGGSQTYQYKEMRMFNASAGKTVMSVEIYKIASSKSYLNTYLENQNIKDSETDKSQTGFIIKQVERNETIDYKNKNNVNISYVTKLFASKKYLYVMTVANRGGKTGDFERFLSSAELNSAQVNQSDNAKTVTISSLMPITINQIGSIAEKSKDNEAETNDSNQPISQVENPILFLTKPRVNYTDSARGANVTGVIRLRLTFSKDGRISKIEAVSSLPHGLLRNAVFSALRMKFIPQEKDDELVSTTKVVEYSFDIY